MNLESLIGKTVQAVARGGIVAVGELKEVLKDGRGQVRRVLIETADKTVVKVSNIRNKIEAVENKSAKPAATPPKDTQKTA